MRKPKVEPQPPQETQTFPARPVFVSTQPGERPWSAARLWLSIALVFGAQIGLIFAFGDHKPMPKRVPQNVPALQFVASDNQWLALDDPTLFALPSDKGFSASAWQQMPAMSFKPFEWTEPARWLDLPVARLGTVLSQYMQSNTYPAFALETRVTPQLSLPPEGELEPVTGDPSRMRLEGDLLTRRLINVPELPAWPADDLLPPSRVQIFVDEAGNVMTAALLPLSPLTPGISLKKADDHALEVARSLQFAALPHDISGQTHWTRGVIVFDWQTLPLPPTATATTAP